jgi:hypothetical protein
MEKSGTKEKEERKRNKGGLRVKNKIAYEGQENVEVVPLSGAVVNRWRWIFLGPCVHRCSDARSCLW